MKSHGPAESQLSPRRASFVPHPSWFGLLQSILYLAVATESLFRPPTQLVRPPPIHSLLSCRHGAALPSTKEPQLRGAC